MFCRVTCVRVNPERPGQWETEDTRGPRDPLGSRVYQELQAKKAPR